MNIRSYPIRLSPRHKFVSPRGVTLVSLVFAALLLTACPKKQKPAAPPPPPPPPAPEMVQHEVRYRGETLGLIAKWYTGSAKNWKDIAAANPDLRPERMNIGDQVEIPAEIVSQRDPLPESFIRQAYRNAPKADSADVQDAMDAADAAGDGDAAAPPGETGAADDAEPSVEDLLKELTADTEPAPADAEAPEAEAPAADAPTPEPTAAPEAQAGSADDAPPADDSEREELLNELLGQ